MKKIYVTPQSVLQTIQSSDILLASVEDGTLLDGDFIVNAKSGWFDDHFAQ